jgi:hypothetical protein
MRNRGAKMKREEVVNKKKRKTRSDKKRDVKPTIPALKSCIYRVSFITNTPVKDVAEILCVKGLRSRKVMDHLSNFFRRDLHFSQTLYMGDLERESLQRKRQEGEKERITVRFTQPVFEDINSLAYALDVTPSKATALLLDASIRNTNLLNAYIKMHLHHHLDPGRMKELKKVLKFINQDNPYDEEISWFTLVSKIFEDIKESTNNVKLAIHHWMDKHK